MNNLTTNTHLPFYFSTWAEKAKTERLNTLNRALGCICAEANKTEMNNRNPAPELRAKENPQSLRANAMRV